jgi:hypothetical protein
MKLAAESPRQGPVVAVKSATDSDAPIAYYN